MEPNIMRKIALLSLVMLWSFPAYGGPREANPPSPQHEHLTHEMQNTLSQAVESISQDRIRKLRFIDSISVTGNYNGEDLDERTTAELIEHTRASFIRWFAGSGIELRAISKDDFDDLEMKMGGIAVQVLGNYNENGRTKYGMCVVSFEIYDFDSQSLAKAIIDKPMVWAAINYQAFPNASKLKEAAKALIDRSLEQAAAQMIRGRETAPGPAERK